MNEEIKEQLKDIREYYNFYEDQGYVTDEWLKYHDRVEKLLEMLGLESEEF